jgi:hypothetical protein
LLLEVLGAIIGSSEETKRSSRGMAIYGSAGAGISLALFKKYHVPSHQIEAKLSQAILNYNRAMKNP